MAASHSVAQKRCREVFLYSDEEDGGVHAEPANPEKQIEGSTDSAPPPRLVSDSEGGCEWAEDLHASPASGERSERLGGGVTVRVVEADNGFEATQRSFQVSMAADAMRRDRAYRYWKEREDFIRQTLGGRVIDFDKDAEVEPDKAVEVGDEAKAGVDMRPIVDSEGRVIAVESRGGYRLSVVEQDFVDVEGEGEEDITTHTEKRINDDNEILEFLNDPLVPTDTQSQSEWSEEEDEEEEMDALTVVAVAQRLIECFHTSREELEPELCAILPWFLSFVVPLQRQRHSLLFASQSGEGELKSVVHTPDLDVYRSQMSAEEKAEVDEALRPLLPLALDDDKVFAQAVERPLRRVLGVYRRLRRPPKDENVVIDGVVMDF